MSLDNMLLKRYYCVTMLTITSSIPNVGWDIPLAISGIIVYNVDTYGAEWGKVAKLPSLISLIVYTADNPEFDHVSGTVHLHA